MIGRKIHVRSTKYDGSRHWEFDSWVIAEKGPLVVTMDFAGHQMETWKGPWTTPYHTRNHFWSDRWYNVMRLEHPHGRGLEGWYCNVSTPAEFDGEQLHWVDLDLDVRVSAGGDAKVLDEQEFLENSARMDYPPEVIEQSRRAVEELLGLARSRRFPFGPGDGA